MKNPIEEIGILSRSNVHIKNKAKLNEILNNMASGGLGKLQVVSDFDKTITKQHEDGIPHLSSFGKFSSCNDLHAKEHRARSIFGDTIPSNANLSNFHILLFLNSNKGSFYRKTTSVFKAHNDSLRNTAWTYFSDV